VHDEQYADFSVLIESDASANAYNIDGEIDLLVLNQEIDAQAARGIRDQWLKRLSDRAAVLILDPQRVFPDPHVREELFTISNPAIVVVPTAQQDCGLEVILHGDAVAERLKVLAAQKPGTSAYLATRQVFSRLGQAILSPLRNETLLREREELREALQTAHAELDTTRRECQTARASEMSEISHRADAQAQIFDLKRALASKDQEKSTLAHEIKKLEAKVEDLELRNRALADDCEAIEAREAAAVADLNAKIASTRAVVAKMEAEHHEEIVQRDVISAGALAEHQDRIAVLEQRLVALATEHSSALSSVEAREADATTALRAEVDAQTYKNACLERELEEVRSAHKARIDDIAVITQSLEAARSQCENQIDQLREANRALSTEKVLLSEALGEMKSNLESKDQELVCVAEALGEMKSNLESKDQELVSVAVALEKRALELHQTIEKHQLLEQRLSAFINRYRQIRETRSWRLTAPIRKMGRLFKSK